jgi:hypothetical protein
MKNTPNETSEDIEIDGVPCTLTAIPDRLYYGGIRYKIVTKGEPGKPARVLERNIAGRESAIEGARISLKYNRSY